MSGEDVINNFVHIELGVNSLIEARKFYSRIFSWTFTESAAMPDYLFFHVQEGRDQLSGGFQLHEGQVSTGNVGLYIQVEDIDLTLPKIVENGGKILLERTRLPDENGYISRFEDPFGNILGLWSPD